MKKVVILIILITLIATPLVIYLLNSNAKLDVLLETVDQPPAIMEEEISSKELVSLLQKDMLGRINLTLYESKTQHIAELYLNSKGKAAFYNEIGYRNDDYCFGKYSIYDPYQFESMLKKSGFNLSATSNKSEYGELIYTSKIYKKR